MKPIDLKRLIYQGAVVLIVLVGENVFGATVYDTFEAEPIITQHAVYWDYGLQIGRSLADPFLLTSEPYSITSVTLDISHAEEFSPNLRIGIYYDSGGLPSALPITFIDPNPTFSMSGQRQLITYSFPAQPVLNPNVQYWLVLEPARVPGTNSNDEVTYAFGTSRVPPYPAGMTRTYESGQWNAWENLSQNSFAFRLDGAAVPEPSTWALFGLGAALWCYFGRCRKS